MYQVAIISCGMIANCAHIPAYRHFADQCEIVAVCDKNETAAKETAERHQISRYFTDAEEMLRVCHPDIVSVCTPNGLHKKYAMAALEAGAHVLVEKPAALSYADAVEMFDLAKKKNRILMACQSLRFCPDRLAAKEAIRSGALGDIFYGEFSRIRRRGIPTWGSFHIRELSGGGALIDIGVHMIDSILWLMGNPRVVSVYSQAETRFQEQTGSLKDSGALKNVVYTQKEYHPEDMDVEDFSSGVITLEGGSRIQFKTAWAANLPNESSIRLCGEKSGLLLPEGKLLSGADQESELTLPAETYPGEEFSGHFHLVENLLAVLAGQATPFVLPEETINVSAVIDLFYRSAALGRPVLFSELNEKESKGEIKK